MVLTDVVDLATKVHEESPEVKIAILFKDMRELGEASSAAKDLGRYITATAFWDGLYVIEFIPENNAVWNDPTIIWYSDELSEDSVEKFANRFCEGSVIDKRFSFSELESIYGSMSFISSPELDDELNVFISELS